MVFRPEVEATCLSIIQKGHVCAEVFWWLVTATSCVCKKTRKCLCNVSWDKAIYRAPINLGLSSKNDVIVKT